MPLPVAKDGLVDRYRAYLIAARRRSPLTADVYLREASHLLAWLTEHGSSAVTCGSGDILGFLVWRQSGAAGLPIESHEDATDEGDAADPSFHALSHKTMARVISSVHSFFKFLRLEGIREDDPSELIETPKQERKLPDVLAPEEVDRFLGSIDESTPNGLRDRAPLRADLFLRPPRHRGGDPQLRLPLPRGEGRPRPWQAPEGTHHPLR